MVHEQLILDAEDDDSIDGDHPRLDFEAKPKFRSAMNTPYSSRERKQLTEVVNLQRQQVPEQYVLCLRNEATVAA